MYHVQCFSKIPSRIQLPVSNPENEGSDVGGEDNNDPIDDDETGEEAEEQQPEPDEYVDLLIY